MSAGPIDAMAIRVYETGGVDKMKWEAVSLPPPGPKEARIRHTASGLNFFDVYTRIGLYPAKLPTGLGGEGAGVVESVGEGVTHVKPGDRVVYTGPQGSYSTHRLIPADRLVKIPDFLSDEGAAAVFLKGLTAWSLLFEVKRPEPGDAVLVWAAAGGVGSLLVPWANALGARVIGVVSTKEKAELARSYGCEDVVLADEDVPARVKAFSGGDGAAVSYDSVGKTSADASLKSLRPRGWYVTYGNASGPVEPIAPLRLQQGGSLTMSRPGLVHFTSKRADLERGAAALWGALRSGALKPDIRQRFALKDAAEAHKALEARQTVGATVLLP